MLQSFIPIYCRNSKYHAQNGIIYGPNIESLFQLLHILCPKIGFICFVKARNFYALKVENCWILLPLVSKFLLDVVVSNYPNFP